MGSAMIRYLIDNARDNNKNQFFLEVHNNNLIARKVYNKFEFIKIGVRKKYYKDKDHAILMDSWV